MRPGGRCPALGGYYAIRRASPTSSPGGHHLSPWWFRPKLPRFGKLNSRPAPTRL